MTKKVLTYVSLAVGCLACIAAIFYLANTIMTATDVDWANGTVKSNIYSGVVVVALALTTIGLALGGVKIIKDFLDKKELNNNLYIFPMAVYFASVLVFNGLNIGFWALDYIRGWILAVIALGGLFITLCPILGKLDEKNSKLAILAAAILGFVLAIVDLAYAGGVSAAALVFVMFMFGAVAAIYVTYVVTSASNKAESNETEAVEANDSTDKAE